MVEIEIFLKKIITFIPFLEVNNLIFLESNQNQDIED